MFLSLSKYIVAIIIGLFFTAQILSSATTVYAYPANFDQNTLFYDSDLYTLPTIFVGKSRSESIALLQQILSQDNSVLATTPITMQIQDADYITRHPEVQAYMGRSASVAEVIWDISQENLGKGTWKNIAIREGINPLFLLAIVQKESGTVYGKCARETCFGQSVGYRINRATGYGCFDGADDCQSEFIGFFSQTYFAARWYRAYTKYCENGFTGYGQQFKTGNTITIQGTTLTLGSNITCATYYYTPHVTPQRNFYNTLVDISNRAGAANTFTPPPPPVIPPPVIIMPPPPVENILVTIESQTTSSPTPLIKGTFGEAGVSATLQFGNEDPIKITQIDGTSWSYQVRFPKPNGTYEIAVKIKKDTKVGVDTSQNELIIQPAVTASPSPDLVEFSLSNNKRGANTPTAPVVDPEIKVIEPVVIVAPPASKTILKNEDPLATAFDQERVKVLASSSKNILAIVAIPAASGTTGLPSVPAPDVKTPVIIAASTVSLALTLIVAQVIQAKRKRRALFAKSPTQLTLFDYSRRP